MSKRPDVLVIGAGVFGLWTALSCARAGLKVLCVDRDRPGAGASGGVVGALTPHMPVRWRPMKQFQLDALLSLEGATQALTEETGLPTGYHRSGRLSPLADQRARARAQEHVFDAEAHWRDHARFEVLDTVPTEITGFLPAESCPFGLVRDTLSGRVMPRLYIEALAAAVRKQADLRLGAEALEVDGQLGLVRFRDETVSAGMIIVAAGWQSPRLAQTRAGKGVKGQAALLRAETPEKMPVVQMPHLYIVPQPGGTVAVGSTSETEWTMPGHDDALDDVIDRARHLCPALANATVVERWAGIRPKPPGREPTIGRVPDAPRLYLASGGYKIGLGIGHLVGQAIAGDLVGLSEIYPLPVDFRPEVVSCTKT
ncbi:MAG: FAD-dependent oxidoreductase [Pseudomonadota bacterium]